MSINCQINGWLILEACLETSKTDSAIDIEMLEDVKLFGPIEVETMEDCIGVIQRAQQEDAMPHDVPVESEASFVWQQIQDELKKLKENYG